VTTLLRASADGYAYEKVGPYPGADSPALSVKRIVRKGQYVPAHWFADEQCTTPIEGHGAATDTMPAYGTQTPPASHKWQVRELAVRHVDPDTGAAGDRVTVWGDNLVGVTACEFDGVAATDIVEHGAQDFTCVVPAHAAGPAAVKVVTQAGEDELPNAFTYAVEEARAASHTAASGPGGTGPEGEEGPEEPATVQVEGEVQVKAKPHPHNRRRKAPDE
jgi:IPT/TIG domain